MVFVHVLNLLMIQYTISYKEMIPSEEQLGNRLLCFIGQNHDSSEKLFITLTFSSINLLASELFFLILAHSVYKM
jgi:hypothetical protein